MFRRLCLLIMIVIPGMAEAAVTIHEVAWMGDTASANHEWIELYNSGDAAVSLDGWTLADGMNLSIALTGSLAAGAYAVLERTSEESAPGTAFILYTGALVNTGATLTLRDATGSIQDQVPGGEEWQSIGGDNTTKETAQYTEGGWITAPGTPGKSNATLGSVSLEEERNVTPAAPASRSAAPARSGSNTPVLLRQTESDLASRIIAPTQVYVNQSVDLTIVTHGVGPSISASLKHVWNFGDTFTASGTTVSHVYAYPGTYVVTVRSQYAKHDETVRHLITVLPVRLSLGRTISGDLILNNDAPYELDISGYTLRGTKELVIPDGTIMLERGTIIVPRVRIETGQAPSLVVLYDGARQLVTSTATPKRDETLAVVPERDEFVPPLVVAAPVSPIIPAVVEVAEASFVSPVLPTATAFPEVAAVATTAARDLSTETVPTKRWPYVALILLIGAVLFIILRMPPAALDRDSTTS